MISRSYIFIYSSFHIKKTIHPTLAMKITNCLTSELITSCGCNLTSNPRLKKYFNGSHHLEEIMYLEDMTRSELLTLLDKYSSVLVTCTLPAS